MATLGKTLPGATPGPARRTVRPPTDFTGIATPFLRTVDQAVAECRNLANLLDQANTTLAGIDRRAARLRAIADTLR